jgi:hypothetical protein
MQVLLLPQKGEGSAGLNITAKVRTMQDLMLLQRRDKCVKV